MSNFSKKFEIPEWASMSVESLFQALKFKDPFTFFHCCRVGREAKKLAHSLGLDDYEQDVLEFSGLLHDIGKIGIPDSILLKNSRLNEDEIKIMKTHAELSCQIIEPFLSVPFFRFLIPGIRYHHERFDGKGYFQGLTGEEIPLAARVIAVVDSMDAMMNSRPYRQALSFEAARHELIAHSHTQFDPRIVQVYLETLASPEKLEEGENKVLSGPFRKSS